MQATTDSGATFLFTTLPAANMARCQSLRRQHNSTISNPDIILNDNITLGVKVPLNMAGSFTNTLNG